MDHMTCPRPFQGQFVFRRLCSPTTKIWNAMQNV